METPLGEARGLGSAREGAEHWWHERLSSIGALFLFIWLAASLLRLPDLSHGSIVEWLSVSTNAAAMLLLVLTTFWHIHMGLKVFIEDYVHEEGSKAFLLLLLTFVIAGATALAVIALLKLAV
jgi:succinate dehydrogenase / fumarate reductase membrane anchor subunit